MPVLSNASSFGMLYVESILKAFALTL